MTPADLERYAVETVANVAPWRFDMNCGVCYIDVAQTDGCGAFCFSHQSTQSHIVGKAPFARGLTSRHPSEQRWQSCGGRFAMAPRNELYKNKQWLVQKYWQEELTSKEMAALAGCGKRTIIEWMMKHDIPRRTRSENRALAWKRGSYGSDEYCAKLSKIASARFATPESRIALSNAAKHQMEDPEQREKIAKGVQAAWRRGDFDGTYDRPETRVKRSRNTIDAWRRGAYNSNAYSQKRSLLMKRQWQRGDFDGCFDNQEYRQTLSKRTSERWANGGFDGIFQSPTTIELAVSKALDDLDIEHISQYRPEGYTRVFDEYIIPRIFIEVNGDYWHANPQLYTFQSLTEHQLTIIHKDIEKQAWAQEHGYHLLVIWEKDIHEFGADSILLVELLPMLENRNETARDL